MEACCCKQYPPSTNSFKMLINSSPFHSCRIFTLRRSSISATLNASHAATVSNKKQTNRKKGGWNRQPSVSRLSVCAVTGPGANTLRMLWSQTSSRFSSSTDSPPLCERRQWKWTTHRGSTPTEEIKRTSQNKRETTQTDCSLDLFFRFTLSS